MAEAVSKLSEASPAPDDAEAAEAIRAELRERFRRLADCDLANQAWEREREAHERLCAEARRANTPLPPPLAAVPFTESHLQQIAKGEA